MASRLTGIAILVIFGQSHIPERLKNNKIIRLAARNALYPGMMFLGLDRMIMRNQPPGYFILCYHGVLPGGSMPVNGRHITNRDFERHLRYFRKHFDILPLEEAFKRARNGDRPKRHSLILTFDDGYQNNLRHALPLLAKYQAPATVFTISKMLESPVRYMWTDWLDLLRIRLSGKPFEFEGQRFLLKKQFRREWYANEAGKSLNMVFGGLDAAKRNTLIQAYRRDYELESLPAFDIMRQFILMNAEELRELDQSDWVDVQGHTHEHPDMSQQPAETIREGLLQNKQLLESALEKEIHSLAFPFGTFDEKAIRESKAAGYVQMLALSNGPLVRSEFPHILPRLNVSGTTNYYSQIVHLRRSFKKHSF